MSWFTYLALFLISATAGKLSLVGWKKYRIDGFERVIGILLCVIFAIYSLYLYWERHWYEGLLPAEIEVSEFIDGQYRFMEDCGVAVYRLTPLMNQRISSAGLKALASARKARDHDDSYHEFGTWKETPYRVTGDGMTLEDRWKGGFGCGELKRDLAVKIYKALEEQGSFFAKSGDAGLIVIPSHGLVVYARFG